MNPTGFACFRLFCFTFCLLLFSFIGFGQDTTESKNTKKAEISKKELPKVSTEVKELVRRIKKVKDELKILRGEVAELQVKTIEGLENSIYQGVMLGLIASMIIIFSFLLIRLGSRNKKISRSLEDLKKNFEGESQRVQNQLIKLKKEIDLSPQSNSEDAIQTTDFDNQNNNSSLYDQNSQDESRDSQETFSTRPGPIYFFAAPAQDGSFNDRFKSVFDDGNQLYKLSIDRSGNSGHFELLINSALYTLASTNKPDYIDPVCEVEGGMPSSYQSTRTIRKGEVVLQGDKWQVTEKAIIKYV